ncbi:hypothetical protein IU500_09065 [Nocardia terpenica]|uniref:Uncharacterized protein n=2 Tax=Nocardia terpenica TaxID=455432 RepID=A0A164I2J1_9NOCA|nr:hypothetical protein [Nocardia terpenica]KZM69044.1 hypothetical protein AWN90_14985 [Nocardia terpenica]MBF6062101.1 hypothetical protein [Nocardia terpenica]MBF6104189.1 hypothetical protein [Nocardia terpenica]MBF6109955.1 hypothetical protein [Nocardia terpenica]MBF6120261.1 hypothetical protein [Nocardia terpenica]
MVSPSSPHPTEPDVMIRVRWDNIKGERLDLWYRACTSAALRFATSFNATHGEDTVTVYPHISPTCTTRLPYERNWLVP